MTEYKYPKLDILKKEYDKYVCYLNFLRFWIKENLSEDTVRRTAKSYYDISDTADIYNRSIIECIAKHGFTGEDKDIIYPKFEGFIKYNFGAWVLSNEIEEFMKDNDEYRQVYRIKWLDKDDNSVETAYNIYRDFSRNPKMLLEYFIDELELLKYKQSISKSPKWHFLIEKAKGLKHLLLTRIF